MYECRGRAQLKHLPNRDVLEWEEDSHNNKYEAGSQIDK